MRRLGVAAALVDGRFIRGDIVMDGAAVDRVGAAPAGISGVAVAGFFDLQVNGFAGVDFATTDPAGYRTATEAMAATGVTSYQPTLISLPWDAYGAALDVARSAIAASDGAVVGVHLEGPFLSTVRHGAHAVANIVPPTVAAADELVTDSVVTHMTIAPENDGALEVIEMLAARGITVALGHTDADAAIAHRAFDAGASVLTHLFNAQRPWGASDPGVSGVAMARPDVIVTAIVDRIHLSDEAVVMAFRACPGRFALISDAISATGMGDGSFPLGDREVTVNNGRATLADGTLAGSVLTMDVAVRNLIDLGMTPERAIAAANAVPAAAARRPDLADLAPGSRADIAVLDDHYEVIRTLRSGREIWSR